MTPPRLTLPIVGLAALLAIAAGATILWWWDQADPDMTQRLLSDEPAILAEGQRVYANNCAACHGARLEGEPDWRMRGPDGLLPAPPHDASGHTWHHSDADLFVLTKYGLQAFAGPDYRSAMPAYDGVLSDREIVAVLSFIRSTWPAEARAHQDRITARQIEEARQ